MLDFINPIGYNAPWNWQMLWNQWLHQGFLWGWYTYDWYVDHQLEVI